MTFRPDDTVCYCFSVTRRDIDDAVRGWRLRTVEEVSRHTGACMGCRTCRPDIEDILAEAWAGDETTPPATLFPDPPG